MKKSFNKISFFTLTYLICINWTQAVSQVKSSVVNDYKDDNLHYNIGAHTPLGKFNYKQIAQKFTAPFKDALVSKIMLNRFIAVENDNTLTEFDQTTFKVNIYSRESSGGPGSKLNSMDIIITDRASKRIVIDLKSKGIKLPDTTFVVAIEYLRIEQNERLTKARLDGTIPIITPHSGFRFLPVYQPFINMAPKKGSATNIWSMDTNDKWMIFDYFAPDLTDLAISAEITY
jgi:hypothetical protein